MKKISATGYFKIHKGKLDEFKQLIPELIKAVKKNEPGAIHYEWYLNEETMECVVLESYADSDAVRAHAGNIGESLQKLLGISDLKLETFGNPDPELKNMIKDMGAKNYPFFAGL
jgi:quinol monooxygenase YgiN